MDHYIDITVLPDPEFPATTLMNALFAKLHRGLVDHGGRDIGISFPEVGQSKRTLGMQIRLHGNAASLDRLMKIAWTQGMRDHIEISPTAPVPSGALHRVVRRVQAKSNPERLRRRLMSRKQIGPDEASAAIPDEIAQRLDLPYIELTSRTTGQHFKLFIEHLKPGTTARSGSFGTYGLSASTTIPWF